MKKLFAIILSAVMLLSVAVVLAVPASAVDGDWIVYGSSSEYYPDFDPVEDDEVPIPGYSYVPGEGLVVTPADWRDFEPNVGLSTRNKVHLKEGVYLKIRIDDFTYSGDKWFTLSISDTQYLSVGSTNVEKYGERLSALMRPSDEGKINAISWYSGNFNGSGSNTMTYDDSKRYDNGKPVFELVVTWNGSSYDVKINGTSAPEAAITWMNEKYGTNDEAYINFNTHHTNLGGTTAFTVQKFGQTEASATIPQGDDYATKRDRYKTIAEIANPDDVPVNTPAILMNGSREASHSKGTTKNSGLTSLTPENYIHYKSDRANLEIGFVPKYEVSYDIDDFPIIVVLTRNLCTCGESLADCFAVETANMYIMTGGFVAADDDHRVQTIDICDEPIVRGNNSYLYFWVDTSDTEWLGWDAEGRFNGARFDIKSINTSVPGMNEFDICFMALFRSLDEAEAYIYDFVGPEQTTPENPDNPDNPDNPGEDSESEPAPDESEIETDPQPDFNPGPEESESKDADDGDTTSAGCFANAGFGLIAMISLACGAGFVVFKKRR